MPAGGLNEREARLQVAFRGGQGLRKAETVDVLRIRVCPRGRPAAWLGVYISASNRSDWDDAGASKPARVTG